MLVWSRAFSVPAVIGDSDYKVGSFFYEFSHQIRKNDFITYGRAEFEGLKVVEKIFSPRSYFSDGMCHFFDKREDFFVRSVFPEGDEMHFIILANGKGWVEAQGCVVVVYGPFGNYDLIGTKEKSTSSFLDKMKKLFFKILIKSFRAAKTERNRKFWPNNQMCSIRICLIAEVKMLIE